MLPSLLPDSWWIPLITFKVDSPWIWEEWEPRHRIPGASNNFSRKKSLPFMNIERLAIGLETIKKKLSSMVWNQSLGGSLACIKYKLIFFQCKEWVWFFLYSCHRSTVSKMDRQIERERERENILNLTLNFFINSSVFNNSRDFPNTLLVSPTMSPLAMNGGFNFLIKRD